MIQKINGFHIETSALSGIGIEEIFNKTLGHLIKKSESKINKKDGEQKLSSNENKGQSKLSKKENECTC